MKREMPEEIKKALLDESAGYVDWDEASEGDKKKAFREANVFGEGAKWMFDLMSEQQKPRPIESAPKDKRILLGMDNGKFWATGEWWEDHNSWSYPFNVEGGKATHWMELPTLEGK